MKILIISFLLLLCFNGFSQTDCPFYKKYMDKGNAIMSQGNKADFQAAINAYTTAMLHCPVKAQEAREKILTAFKAIENLKNKAVQSEAMARTALVQQMRAEQQKQNADKARYLALQQLQLQLKKTDSALEKANTLISAFYFYDDKFAITYGPSRMHAVGTGLAIKERSDGEMIRLDDSDFKGEGSTYYYIDRNGKPIYKFDEWSWAEGFESDGFARVRKYIYKDSTRKKEPVNYLIDTFGNKYLSAYSADNVKPDIKAYKPLNSYDKFQPEFFNDSSLEVLLLNNQIEIGEKSMREIFNFKNLTNLQLGRCQIENIPSQIGGLSDLQVLLLPNNKITNLPYQFWELKNMAVLNIGNNNLKDLPAGIGKLSYLEYLDLNSNKMINLPEDIWTLENLEVLDISGNKLNRLSDGIGNLRKLTKLKLRYNPLGMLPTNICQLENLTYLNLYDCELTILPEEFGQLKNLKELYLNYNYLTSLPESIGNLVNLPSLNLVGNNLQQIPNTIGNLINLKSLLLSGNQLNDLPASIGNLQNLEYLTLGSNQFKHLPPTLFNLKKLKYLDISGNNIPEIEIENFKKEIPGCNVYE